MTTVSIMVPRRCRSSFVVRRSSCGRTTNIARGTTNGARRTTNGARRTTHDEPERRTTNHERRTSLSSIDLSEDHVEGADQRDDVGDEMTANQRAQPLQIAE